MYTILWLTCYLINSYEMITWYIYFQFELDSKLYHDKGGYIC